MQIWGLLAHGEQRPLYGPWDWVNKSYRKLEAPKRKYRRMWFYVNRAGEPPAMLSQVQTSVFRIFGNGQETKGPGKKNFMIERQ